MSDELDTDWSPQERQRIGQQLSSLGRLGFCIQLALLVAPLLLALLVLSRVRQSGGGIGLGNLVSFASSLVMMFTTFWFYRYIRLGNRMRDPAQFPPRSAAVSTLWVGFWAGCVGVVLSLLLLLAAAWRVLYVLLANPQTGMLVAPTLGTNPTYSISAIDAVTLTSNIIGLGAELLVLGLSLWLLFRLTWPSKKSAREVMAAH
jgi:hypothetical protein